ncbi:MAG: flagellar basal body P-ring protein FlgI [Gammaproteobacteria bacterium]|nr:flagellar basal body P-ring protein FlgI [Gammaproteobacteria bacterium]MCW8909348.1 flagellar basal body P-ring protein FlgI [Gammaproteobacteria bacterium]MCW9005780.1 flagellar basal body P-ring protein FlgI [Gammaproteobacteria bacterium]MCW9055944.1 flagellar basal body P-ring protein FlgI [Gammaproteobacteria bacterium]
MFWRILITVITLNILLLAPVQAQRIKDIASVAGVRSNQLVGYGLVVGLDGTGDQTSQTPFTVQSFKNMLMQYGINLPANMTLQLKNVAAVSIHAELPPFSKPGQQIDITVSSLGNAKSLRGGSLLMTPLKGADGNIYAVAQGNLIVGGFGVAGSDGSKVTVNVPSVGRIPNGASVERTVPNVFDQMKKIVLNLHRSDFTTAKRMVEVINRALGPDSAEAIDAVSVQVLTPPTTTQKVEFISFLENLEVSPDDAPARIIINSRTGTVVISSTVRVKPAAVSHGSLTVTISEDLLVSQPNPLARGQTAVVPDTQIDIEQPESRMFMFTPGVSLNEIVQAVNQVGAAPGDLVAILEALKQAGSLTAELIVI